MIHGHTKIELKNVKTGLKEIIEHDNTFYGSNIAYYLQASIDTPFSSSPFIYQNNEPWKKIVGGLLLFRDTIPENSRFMPAGNKMTGKGSADVSNSDNPPELGSFNSLESSGNASSLTQVYDFSTNQANGQIACVCLTSQEGGLVGYGNASGTRYPSLQPFGRKYSSYNNSSLPIIGQLADDGCRYSFSKTADTLTVRKTKTCGIDKGSALAGLYSEYTHDISSLQTIYKNNQWRSFYCGNNIFRFLIREQYTVNPSDRIYYLEYNAANNTLTEKYLVNNSAYSVRVSASSYYDYTSGFTNDNNLVASISTNNGYYPIILGLSDSLVKFVNSNAVETSSPEPIYVSDGLYIIRTDSDSYIIDIVNDTIYPIDANNAQSRGNGPSRTMQHWGYTGMNDRSSIVNNPLYLATINNLETPVTKTAAQTMKITYTLQEV